MNKQLTIFVRINSFEHVNSTIDALLRQTYVNTSIIAIVDMSNVAAITILEHYNSIKIKVLVISDGEWITAIKKISSNVKPSYVSLVYSGTIVSPIWADTCINELKYNKHADGIFANSVKLSNNGLLSSDPDKVQSLADIIFINNFTHKSPSFQPLITQNYNYKYLLPNNIFPNSASTTSEILAGVRDAGNYKKTIGFSSVTRFVKQLKYRDIKKRYESLIDESTTDGDRYVEAYALFFKKLLSTGNVVSAFKIFALFISNSGNRKRFLKRTIGRRG